MINYQNKLEAANCIRSYQYELNKAKSAIELDEIIHKAIDKIEELEREHLDESPLDQIALALNTVSALLSQLNFHEMNLDALFSALRDNIPKSEKIENCLTHSTFKLFFSYFMSIQRLRIIEENRKIQMERFWERLSQKLEANSSP